jgi:hypothetical protein
MLSLVAGVRISDSASGQRVLRRSILPIIYPLPNTLDFTPAMSTRALHEGLRMVEIPIPYKERSGRSKLHVIRDGLRFTKSIVWTALTYNPVRIFGGLGLLLLLLAGLLILGQSIGIALGMLLGWSFPQLFGALVLAVRRPDPSGGTSSELLAPPDPDDFITEGDSLLIMVPTERIREVEAWQ